MQGGGDGSSDDDSGGGGGEEKEDGDDDGDDVEEWDKYEALHDDVDKQVTSLSFYWVLFTAHPDTLYTLHLALPPGMQYTLIYLGTNLQERTEERLHEEDLEVVWEKGGSGLVFYTDASYWDEKDGGR